MATTDETIKMTANAVIIVTLFGSIGSILSTFSLALICLYAVEIITIPAVITTPLNTNEKLFPKLLKRIFPSDIQAAATPDAMPTHITIAPAQSSMKLSCDTHPFLNARPKPFVNVLYEIPDVKSDRFLLIIPLILAGFKLGINKNDNRQQNGSANYIIEIIISLALFCFFWIHFLPLSVCCLR